MSLHLSPSVYWLTRFPKWQCSHLHNYVYFLNYKNRWQVDCSCPHLDIWQAFLKKRSRKVSLSLQEKPIALLPIIKFEVVSEMFYFGIFLSAPVSLVAPSYFPLDLWFYWPVPLSPRALKYGVQTSWLGVVRSFSQAAELISYIRT